MFRQGAELGSTLQLLMATKEKPYADRFQELIWPALDRAPGYSIAAAVRAMPFFDAAYREKLVPYVRKYREEIDRQSEGQPVRRPDHPRWLGRQRSGDQLGVDELPRPQGVPGDRRP